MTRGPNHYGEKCARFARMFFHEVLFGLRPRPKAVALGLVAAFFCLPPLPGRGQEQSYAKLQAVPFTQVQIADAFWQPRQETNRTVTLPHCLEQVKPASIDNFAKAAGLMPGTFQGNVFNDSDIYKVIEGAGYILAVHPDKQMEARLDAIIDLIAAAQQSDGYLDTYYTLKKKPKQRWTNVIADHEMYCAGHLFEAAVAYDQGTGKKKLLEVARRVADHIDGVFGPGKRVDFPGHPEIELALTKLYRHTGELRYRKLLEFFIAVRGGVTDEQAAYRQAHLPIKRQREIVGHAVRAMYLYCGVADVYTLTGDADYGKSLEAIWRDTVLRKMYVIGGVGARHGGESFGEPYELPNQSAYCETCAAIGLAMWNHRLLQIYGEGRFADVLERALYNGILSGVSLDGSKFFYVNPLASSGNHHRQSWFGCACCPPNLLRMLAQLGGSIYSRNDDGIWVNLYVGSKTRVPLKAGEVEIKQETQYPWSGQVKIAVAPASPAGFAVNLRIPGWCSGPAEVRVNGQILAECKPDKGYVAIQRTWKPGDVIELNLPMEIQYMVAHPKVEADQGRVALQRGPIVYCLEAVDHGGSVATISLPRGTALTGRFMPDLLGGVTVLKGRALAADLDSWKDRLYQPAEEVARTKPIEITAVPYFAWDNRAAGEMIVWLPEK